MNSPKSSRVNRLDEEVTKIENGGLFTKEKCTNLAKYSIFYEGKFLISMTIIKMAL